MSDKYQGINLPENYTKIQSQKLRGELAKTFIVNRSDNKLRSGIAEQVEERAFIELFLSFLAKKRVKLTHIALIIKVLRENKINVPDGIEIGEKDATSSNETR